MYDPFVRAFNYALEEMSQIKDVDGLPDVSPDKEIVFVCNHQRAVKSEGLQRNSRAKPDIVLLQWQTFKGKMSKELRDEVSYSQSYQGLCDSKSNWEVVWREVRSTVEMKITGSFKSKQGMKNSDGDFDALEELPAYVALDNDQQSMVAHEPLRAAQCSCTSFGGFPLLIFLNRSHQELGEIE